MAWNTVFPLERVGVFFGVLYRFINQQIYRIKWKSLAEILKFIIIKTAYRQCIFKSFMINEFYNELLQLNT